MLYEVYDEDMNLQAHLAAELKLRPKVLHTSSCKQTVSGALEVLLPATSPIIRCTF